MTTQEIQDFYQRQIAVLPRNEQLQLAEKILNQLVPQAGLPIGDEEAADLGRQQRIALAPAIGCLAGASDSTALRHDEVLYDGW